MAGAREEQGEEVDNPSSLIFNPRHPLLIRVVASKIFDFVKLSEIRTLRLVCKDWYSASLPIWRRNAQIHIDKNSLGGAPRSLMWESLGTQLDDVAGEQPFRNFHLHSTHFLADISSSSKLIYRMEMDPPTIEQACRNTERFWANCGHWIHKLELSEVYVTDWGAFKRAIFEQTPNLQEITLHILTDGWKQDTGAHAHKPLPVETTKEQDERPAQLNLNLKSFRMTDRSIDWKLPFGWSLLFNRFPNIQVLELPPPYNRSHSDELVECLGNMLMSPARRPNLPITDLRLKVTLDGPSEKILRNPLVKLKVLHLSLIDYSDKDNSFDILRAVMHHHRNTLEELHLLNYDDPIDIWESAVGPFISLTELELEGTSLAFNFHFINKFPNLKVLKLEQDFFENMLMDTNWTVLKAILPHLREFYFLVDDPENSEEYLLSEEMLERLGKVMPNLECFTGQLTNQTLRVVCRNWRQLKKLKILCGLGFKRMHTPEGDVMDIDDVGITGIVPGSDERVPCIADLKELRLLSLEHVTLIGNASVFDGFLKLPHLDSLEIYPKNKISKRGLRYLERCLDGELTIAPMCGHSE